MKYDEHTFILITNKFSMPKLIENSLFQFSNNTHDARNKSRKLTEEHCYE